MNISDSVIKGVSVTTSCATNVNNPGKEINYTQQNSPRNVVGYIKNSLSKALKNAPNPK